MSEMNDDFRNALRAASRDHDRFGHIAREDFSENGAMRAVGIARSDALRLAMSLQETYGVGLATGWDCPVCGQLRDAEGDCPEGHEFDPHQTAEGGKLGSLLSIVEICLAIGVHLERARWETAV